MICNYPEQMRNFKKYLLITIIFLVTILCDTFMENCGTLYILMKVYIIQLCNFWVFLLLQPQVSISFLVFLIKIFN